MAVLTFEEAGETTWLQTVLSEALPGASSKVVHALLTQLRAICSKDTYSEEGVSLRQVLHALLPFALAIPAQLTDIGFMKDLVSNISLGGKGLGEERAPMLRLQLELIAAVVPTAQVFITLEPRVE